MVPSKCDKRDVIGTSYTDPWAAPALRTVSYAAISNIDSHDWERHSQAPSAGAVSAIVPTFDIVEDRCTRRLSRAPGLMARY